MDFRFAILQTGVKGWRGELGLKSEFEVFHDSDHKKSNLVASSMFFLVVFLRCIGLVPVPAFGAPLVAWGLPTGAR